MWSNLVFPLPISTSLLRLGWVWSRLSFLQANIQNPMSLLVWWWFRRRLSNPRTYSYRTPLTSSETPPDINTCLINKTVEQMPKTIDTYPRGLLCFPPTVAWRMASTRPSDRVMRPYHLSFLFFKLSRGHPLICHDIIIFYHVRYMLFVHSLTRSCFSYLSQCSVFTYVCLSCL